MSVRSTVVRVTTTGSAGSASGTGVTDHVISGYFLGANINFHASTPATTDTTIRTTTAPTYNLLAVSNSATDAFIQVAGKPVDNANTAITNAHAPIPVNDRITVALAQADALTDAVVVELFWDDGK